MLKGLDGTLLVRAESTFLMVSYEDARAAILGVCIKSYERFEQQVPACMVRLCIQGGNANPHFG